jgi:hypothetical protein
VGALLAGAPARGEIFSLGEQKLLAFADDANGNQAPLRVISGPSTGLEFLATLALDPVHRELYVGRTGEILVFDMDASGDVEPLRRIHGSAVGDVLGIAVDVAHDEIWVTDPADDAVRVFARPASGLLEPIRSLVGAATTLDNPTGLFVDLVHGELVVLSNGLQSLEPSVAVFALAAIAAPGDHDVAPIRRIAGSNTGLGDPRGVAIDLASDQLIVSDRSGRIHFFARTADGNVEFLDSIGGPNTQLGGGNDLVLLESGELLVGIDGAPSSSIVGHAFDATGNASPIRQIVGASTQLTFSTGVAATEARSCAAAKVVDGCLFRDSFDGGDACRWSSTAGAPACP